jgi:hypothetical protein
MLTRRGFIGALSLLLAVGLLMALPGGGLAQMMKSYKIGMSLPVTGADADSSDAMVKGAQMAIEEVNQKAGPRRRSNCGSSTARHPPPASTTRPRQRPTTGSTSPTATSSGRSAR